MFVLDQGVASPLAGMSLSDADAVPGEIFTVDLSVPATGTLADSAPGASLPTPQSLHLTGTLDQVNAALSDVTYTGTADGAAQLTVSARDSSVGGSQVSATINPPPTRWPPRSRVAARARSSWSPTRPCRRTSRAARAR